MKKLEFIDSLRGIAIFIVILYHSSLYGPSNFSKLFNQIISQGARGVQLFYLVSAFTIFLTYKNRFGIEKSPIKYFFIRRFFRIAPMYYLAIIYYLFQDGLGAKLFLGDQNNSTFFNIFSHFTFTNGFNPYWINSIVPGGWSIGVEMIFYGVIPLLFLKIRNLNQAFVFFKFNPFNYIILPRYFL